MSNKYLLPTDLYQSKDWKDGDYNQRVEWLHVMYEQAKTELEYLEETYDELYKLTIEGYKL